MADNKKSSDKPETAPLKETIEQIKTEIKKSNPEIDPLGINENLGSFGSGDASIQNEINIEEQKLNTTDIVELEKIQTENEIKLSTHDKNTKIDFAKFEKAKNKHESKTKLGIKLDIWLRNPKSTLIIWLTILFVVTILWSCQITYVVLSTKILHSHDNYPPYGVYKSFGAVGNVFSYISIGLPVLPFLYLLTTAIVGINGMLSSKVFHYCLWLFLLVAIILFIVSSFCDIYFLVQCNSFSSIKS